ncbi:hypothetical protein CVT25_014865 [Psilocybe cyanescens]|uniref:Uncharacterized protein n=1 Tax=Psilocybe cyanescens TaxID=93625 RepID=A0A409X582_PSICY|nr:hypothetical protein CVT25_014865 [Psilocybe cyanescens]
MSSLSLSAAYQALLAIGNLTGEVDMMVLNSHLLTFYQAMIDASDLEKPVLVPDDAGYHDLHAQLKKIGVTSNNLSKLDEAREELKQAIPEPIDVDALLPFELPDRPSKVKVKVEKVDVAPGSSQRAAKEGRKAETEMSTSDCVNMKDAKCLGCASAGRKCLLAKDLIALLDVSDVDRLRKVLKGNRKIKTNEILNPSQSGASKRKAQSEASPSKAEPRSLGPIYNTACTHLLDPQPVRINDYLYVVPSSAVTPGPLLETLEARVEAMDVEDQGSGQSVSTPEVDTRVDKALRLFGEAQGMYGSISADRAGLGARMKSLGATMVALRDSILSLSKDFAALEVRERDMKERFEEAKRLSIDIMTRK